MITMNDLERMNGIDVHGPDGAKIGSAGQVYLDDRSGQPAWVAVRTGLLGTKESFVPLERAALTGDRLEVPFGKDQVKDAPSMDTDGNLGMAEVQALSMHYGLDSTGTGGQMTDAAMMRSEEQLRKYVATEHQQEQIDTDTADREPRRS